MNSADDYEEAEFKVSLNESGLQLIKKEGHFFLDPVMGPPSDQLPATQKGLTGFRNETILYFRCWEKFLNYLQQLKVRLTLMIAFSCHFPL